MTKDFCIIYSFLIQLRRSGIPIEKLHPRIELRRSGIFIEKLHPCIELRRSGISIKRSSIMLVNISATPNSASPEERSEGLYEGSLY